MEKNHPSIKEFAYICQAFLYSEDEAGLNAAWQTVIFTVPADHKELPLLHQAAKARQAELRKAAAAAKKADEDAAKSGPLITKDTSRGDNERYYGKR